MSYRRFTDKAEATLDSALRLLNHDDLNDFHLHRVNTTISIALGYADLARTAARVEADDPRRSRDRRLWDSAAGRGLSMDDTDS